MNLTVYPRVYIIWKIIGNVLPSNSNKLFPSPTRLKCKAHLCTWGKGGGRDI